MYAGGRFYEPYTSKKYSVYNINGTHHLNIQNITDGNIGYYECKDDVTSDVYGSVNIEVYNQPLCEYSNREYIGKNTCNIEPDELMFTCSISFNNIVPKLYWRILNNSYPFSNSMCQIRNKTITCTITKYPESEYDGSAFRCHTINRLINCTGNSIKIAYFHTLNHSLINNIVNCTANTNQIVKHQWIYYPTNHMLKDISDSQTILINNPGKYICFINYTLNGSYCSAVGAEIIHSSKDTNNGLIIYVIIGIFPATILLIVMLFCCWKKIYQKPKLVNQHIESLL